jgi:hypothetical protein
MKRIIPALFFMLSSLVAISQTNIFPTTGNVGIGTTSPGTALEVRGISKFATTNNRGDSWFPFVNGSSYVTGYSPLGEGDIVLRTDNGTSYLEHLRIKGGSGNVGIGTINPQKKLDILTSGNGGLRVSGNSSTYVGSDISIERTGTSTQVGQGSTLQFGDTQFNSHAIIQNSSGGLQFFNFNDYSGGWAERMRITLDGNIGIGTATPGDKLSVIGNISVPLLSGIGSVLSDRGTYDGKSFGNYSLGWYGDSENSGAPMAYFSGFGGIKFFAQGQPRMTVAPNGNVGIGTTTPGSFKLAVNGKIWTQEVNVQMSNPGPDYVFEKNYDLLSLTELETFINQNKHLPEVPSAKEMEKDGLNLKEMNLILLKKVEELTLHLIEQRKVIEKQNARITTLESSKHN